MEPGIVTTVMHDTADLAAAVSFWTKVLGLEVAYDDGRFAYLDPLSDGGPRLAFQAVPEVKATKNRLHLDVRVPDRAGFVAEVEALGGSVVGEHQEGEFPPWTVLADPEGNEFCVLSSHAR